MLEFLQQTDQQLFLFLNGMHSPFWDNFMYIFTGKLTWVAMYAAILYVLYKNFNIYVCLFAVVAIALTITYADQICATVIRPIVERSRPSRNPDIAELVHLVNGKRGGRFGFPSCHAANSFALAFFVMLFFKNRLLTCFILLWATLNSYSRIYVGVHYPGDLIAGTIVGLSGALLIYYLLIYTLKKTKLSLRATQADMELIVHPQKIKHTRVIIYTGLLTILVFTIYSLLVVL